VHPRGLEHAARLLWPELELQRGRARRAKLLQALQVWAAGPQGSQLSAGGGRPCFAALGAWRRGCSACASGCQRPDETGFFDDQGIVPVYGDVLGPLPCAG
jgi:hypothetical protein